MKTPYRRFWKLACLALLVLGAGPTLLAQTITVTSANPNNAPQGTVNLNVLINGQGFKKGALAKFFISGTTDPGGIQVNSTAFINSGQLNANINVAGNAAVTKFDIVVALLDGRSGKGTQLFQVTAPDPAIAYLDDGGLSVMNADSTNQINILQLPNNSGIYIFRASWSPDRTQLVFASNIQGYGIYVINKDGTGLHKVIATNDTYFNYPVWSPAPAADGKWKIAFADNNLAIQPVCHDLYLVNLDGTGLVNLTNTTDRDEFYPTWDPYATRLAAQSWPCGNSPSIVAHLFEYNLALVSGVVGITNTTDLTATGPLLNANIFTPDWAKTQDKIVVLVQMLNDINNSAFWIVSLADPTNPVELSTTYGTSDRAPSWFPDDSKIVFSFRTAVGKPGKAIGVINPDGSGFTSLGVFGEEPASRRCCPTCAIACAP